MGEIMYYSSNLDNPVPINRGNFNYLLLLIPMLPLDLFIITELYYLYIKYSIERFYKKSESPLIVNSPNLLPNLSHIDYAVFDKTGPLTSMKKKLSLLYFYSNNTIYEFDDYDSFLQKFLEAGSKYNAQSILMNDCEHKDTTKNSQMRLVNCRNLIDDYFSSNLDEFFHDLLESLVLANSMRFEYCKKQEKRVLTFQFEDDKLLYNFANNLNFELIEQNMKTNNMLYSLRIIKRCHNYKILGLCEELAENHENKFTIIYENLSMGKYVLLIKIRFSQIKNDLKLSKEETESLSSILGIFNGKGILDPLIYAKRTLNLEEGELFAERYRNLQSSLISQKSNLIEIMSQLSYDLEIIGIVGIQEDLEPDIFELIKFLKSQNINSWILTGDNKLNAYNVASRIGIFDNEATQYCIESENHQDLVKQVKKILGDLSIEIKPIVDREKKQNNIRNRDEKFHKNTIVLNTVVDEKYDKFIMINGRSFDIILNDDYLLPHFVFICRFLRTVVGFNFSAENKGKIVDILKKKFIKNATVMAIGNGFNDILMMNSADVSIEITPKFEIRQKMKAHMMLGDFVLSNLKQIKELMMFHSGVCFDSCKRMTEISYYKSVLYGITLFIYAFFDKFFSNCIYDPLLTLFYYSIFNISSHILCLLFYKKIPSIIRSDFSEIYLEGRFQKRFLAKKIFFGILESCLLSSIISIITLFGEADLISSGGRTSNYNSLGLIYAYSYSFFIHIKVLYIKS